MWVSVFSVRDAVTEVDLEPEQRRRPVPGSGSCRDGVVHGEVHELAGGVLVGEVALGLDRFAHLRLSASIALVV